MARAVGLQNLLSALAFKYIAEESVTHAHIPDDPFVESERRQIIFGQAVGHPHFLHPSENEKPVPATDSGQVRFKTDRKGWGFSYKLLATVIILQQCFSIFPQKS